MHLAKKFEIPSVAVLLAKYPVNMARTPGGRPITRLLICGGAAMLLVISFTEAWMPPHFNLRVANRAHRYPLSALSAQSEQNVHNGAAVSTVWCHCGTS